LDVDRVDGTPCTCKTVRSSVLMVDLPHIAI
jgi:hypothetical protein